MRVSKIRYYDSASAQPASQNFALLVFGHYLHAGEFKKIAQWSTNVAHLSKAGFSTLPFPIPPRAEQKRIVAEAHRRLEESAAKRTSVTGGVNARTDGGKDGG